MSRPNFHTAEAFRSENGYTILPFRFVRWQKDEVFLTNDVGEFVFMSASDFSRFVTNALSSEAPAFSDLAAKHFLGEPGSSLPIELLATKLRTKKLFLEGFTKLHMFVVTLRCEHSCPYCQVSRVTENRSQFDMTDATAEAATRLMFSSPSPGLKMEFQGGEPLLNFDRIKRMIQFAEERNKEEQRHLEFVIATNLAMLTDEMLAFLADHPVSLSTSLDGPARLHDLNRPRPGNNSHELLERGLERARLALGEASVSALMTTTERSLESGPAIIEEYRRLGFHGIFLRPISPYGFAVKTGAARNYETDRFIEFYKTGLARVIELNREGYPMVEFYAQILLRKILTPFATGYIDLQSPTGLGIGGVVYNYDGSVFASDEGRMLAEMGDTSFRLGDVNQSYAELFGGDLLRSLVDSSCHETMPGCSECAFSPYCGTDPVFNWATQGDPVGHRPTSSFCSRNMAIIRHLLELLRNGDPFVRVLLARWAVESDGTHSAIRTRH